MWFRGAPLALVLGYAMQKKTVREIIHIRKLRPAIVSARSTAGSVSSIILIMVISAHLGQCLFYSLSDSAVIRPHRASVSGAPVGISSLCTCEFDFAVLFRCHGFIPGFVCG